MKSNCKDTNDTLDLNMTKMIFAIYRQGADVMFVKATRNLSKLRFSKTNNVDI